MKIRNHTRNTLLAEHAQIADTYLSRLVGLLNRSDFAYGQALIITRCQQIHMLFMRFAIDVVFIDTTDRVVGLVKNIKPFHISPIFWRSARAVELPAGTILATKTVIGDQLQFSP